MSRRVIAAITGSLVLVHLTAQADCPRSRRCPGRGDPRWEAVAAGLVEMSLAGKVAIVTGGASGIGKAVAFALAKGGTAVALADIRVNRPCRQR